MKLTARLEKIASLIDSGKKIADIGTDHGYIPAYLLSEGIIDFAVLGDVNKGPLENAKSEIIALGFEDKCNLRLGNGLDILAPGEVDQIIIAGMGGQLISQILEVGKNVSRSAEKLILQPMQGQEDLRKYLDKSGYSIIGEYLEKEDFRIYEIIVASYDKDKNLRVSKESTLPVDEVLPYIDIDEDVLDRALEYNVLENLKYEVPKLILNNEDNLVKLFLDKKIHEYSSILYKLPEIDKESIKLRRSEIEFKLQTLKDLRKKLD